MKYIYIASLWESIQEGFYKLMILLDSFIYSFINWIYQIILNLADTDIFTNTEIINSLVNRIYIIIGVIMLFLIAYTLLKSMVNPDDALKGKQSPVKLITSVIISIVLIALVPAIFQFAREFQSALLKNNTIGKLIVGTDDANSNAKTINDGGFYMAIGVFQAFFHPTSEHCQYAISETNTDNSCNELIVDVDIDKEADTNGDGKISYSEFFAEVKEVKNFLMIQKLSSYVVDGDIEYIWLFSAVAGVLVVYVLISYCIEIALRTIKLAVYQLIAPLPILSRLVPSEQGNKVFSSWLKATISTYIEVFIRLAILYFAILVIDLILDSWKSIFTGAFQNGASPIIGFLTLCFLIIGVVLFVKQAPEILKEITGLDGGKYGKAFMRGVGMMGASLGGGATATIRSFASDKDKTIGRRIGRALTAGASANARGLWQGSKVNKLGDIPNAAGKASTNALTQRGKQDAAGGFLSFKKDQVSAVWDKAKNWASPEDNARAQEFSSKLDSDVSSAQSVYKKTQAYVDAKALKTKLENELEFYKNESKTLLQKNNNDQQKVDDIFIQKYGKTLDAMEDELKIAKINKENIERTESVKKRDIVASAARDFAFQFTSNYADLSNELTSELENDSSISPTDRAKINEFIKLMNEKSSEDVYQVMSGLLSDKNNVTNVQKALDYVEAMDLINTKQSELKSRAAFNEMAYKAKINNASGGDKKK